MSEKTANNKIIKASAGYIVGNYLLKGITFLSAPIFTRLLSTEEYGNFGTYTSYEAILYIIIGLALHSSLNSAKYRFQEDFNEYVSSIVLLTGISTGIWLVLSNVFYDLYSEAMGFSRIIVNILVLHCFASSMLQFYNVYVGLNYKVRSFLKITWINALSHMGLSILLLVTVFSGERLLGRIIGTALPIFCIAVYIVFYFYKKKKPIIRKEYWKYAVGYSLPIIPHGISQVILASFDRIMIKKMVGAAEAGLYNFAYSVNALVRVVSISLNNVWKPWFYERMNEKDYNSIRKMSNNYVYGLALFTSLVMLVSPELIIILGDKQYWSSTNCVIPVVLGGFFSFIYTIPVMVEYYYEKTKCIAAGTTLAAVINIVLNYYFIQKFGYIAAAYTTLATYFLYFTFHFILARKIHGQKLFSGIIIYGISIGVVLVGEVSLLLEKYIVIRWGMELVLGIYSLYWTEKNFHISELIKKRRNS